jgi:hypothetical protein
VDLGDGVLDLLALDGFLDRAILDLPLQADELALLERLGEVGEIAPGVDAVPFGAGFVLALLVLPALAGGQAEDGVVLLVLRGLRRESNSPRSYFRIEVRLAKLAIENRAGFRGIGEERRTLSGRTTRQESAILRGNLPMVRILAISYLK